MKNKNNFKYLLASIVVVTSILIVMGTELINTLIMVFKKKDAIKPIYIIYQAPVYFGVIIIVLSIVFWNLSKKILQLNKAIHKIAQGDFSTRLDIEKSGPLEVTYTDINLMAEELENTAALRDDFINEFSHEFKTPITSIKGFADLLQKKKLAPEEENKALEIISKEAQRLSNLSSNIILLTNLDSIKVLSRKKTFSITDQLRQVIIMLMPLFDRKNIKVHLNLDEVNYVGDSELLEQVWINILNNASKFVTEGGNIWIDLKTEGDQLIINFKNDGPLIEKEEIGRLQDKFYQVNKTGENGLGLGLAIVKKILNLHHGRLIIKSSKEELTQFEVKLPW